MEELSIRLIIEELKDWDPVVDLQTKALAQVINDDYILEFAVLNDPQVLDIEPVLGPHAVLARKDVAD